MMTAIAETSATVSAPTRKRWGPVAVAAAFAGGTLAAMVAIAGAHFYGVPTLGCGFKYLTTLPCPGCGGTRCLGALGALEFARGFAFNPAVAVAATIALVSLPLTALDAGLNRGRIVARVGAWSRRRAFTWAVGGVLFLNWVYLLLAGR